ncbi:MAG: pyridoxamine 5'-phosphate oxidase family protein [Longimicrobiales bacterium]
MPRSPSPPLFLPDILEEIWKSLVDGAAHARDAFHAPTVGTTRDGIAQLRTVVLRFVDRDAGELGFHTDARSLKRTDLTASPHLAWHFYDRKRKIQLRILGHASTHTDDEVADRAWHGVTPLGRRCYGQLLGPGQSTEQPDVPLPHLGDLQTGDPQTIAECRQNFCVVRCHLTEIDWLHLRFEGHQRARFTREGSEWSGCWIAP